MLRVLYQNTSTLNVGLIISMLTVCEINVLFSMGDVTFFLGCDLKSIYSFGRKYKKHFYLIENRKAEPPKTARVIYSAIQ